MSFTDCTKGKVLTLKNRRERAERLKDSFDQFGLKSREVLTMLLEKYEMHGTVSPRYDIRVSSSTIIPRADYAANPRIPHP